MCHLSPKSLPFSQYQVLLTSVEISFDFFVSACSHTECVFGECARKCVHLHAKKKKKSPVILYVSFHLPLLLPRITSAVLLVAVVTGQPWPLRTRRSPSPRPSAFSRARPRSGACTPSSGKGRGDGCGCVQLRAFFKMLFFSYRPCLETRKRVAMSSSSTPRG